MVNTKDSVSIFRYHRSLLLLTSVASIAHGFLLPSSHPTVKTLYESSIPIAAAADFDADTEPSSPGTLSRRRMSFVALPSLLTALSLPNPALAFPNKISTKYDDRPKRRGPPPKDLYISKRTDFLGGGDDYDGLKPCAGAPNCFCSTDSLEYDPDHHLPPWSWPAGTDRETAFRQLEAVIAAYEPGQGGIDGGGFAVQKSEPGKGYLYVQFEALKNGYVDDVEFAVLKGTGEREVQVRSSSRVGYLDYGVNAKRINYIARALGEKGWSAPGVDFKKHPDYAMQNGISIS